MATNLSAPVTEDIWHLSIDDLLSPLPEKPRLGGPGPFVINLSSSTAGIGLPTLNLAGCESAHAYEIQRNEDGRTRYRLRLGPFNTEEEADLILDMVREIYPSALTATAGADDLKSIATIRAKVAAAAEARKPPAPPKQPEPPVVLSRVDPINAALKAVASRPAAAVAPKPQATPMAPTPALLAAPKPEPVVPSAVEALTVSIDLSIAEIIPPKRPEVPTVAARAESSVTVPRAAPTFVEPPLVTERVEFTAIQKVRAPVSKDTASPPIVTQRADFAVTVPPAVKLTAPAAKPAVVAAPVAAAPAPKPIDVRPIAAMPSQAPVAPPIVAAPAAKPDAIAPEPAPTSVASTPAAPVYLAPAAPSLPKQPASIWEPLPVAPRSPGPKFAAPTARPAMSVSAPLVRRPAPAAAASAVKPAAPAPAMVSAQPPIAQAAPMATVAKSPVAPKPAAATTATAAATQKSPAQRPAAPVEKHLDFDSTQTMRALTPKELADENALPWFVIELATSPDVFDPDSVPNLDIFAEYRLYSVAETATGSIVHSLRVGFFSAEIAAKAVASYLAGYYDKPAIKRVSLAERERFAEQAVEARKDVGDTGRHAVIEITDDLVARRRRFSGNAQPASPAP